MPRDPRDWLPEGHLAWFVLASVDEMDLAAFYGSYRQDGWGRAAFEPSMISCPRPTIPTAIRTVPKMASRVHLMRQVSAQSPTA